MSPDDLSKLRVPDPTMGDRKAAALIVRMAALDQEEAMRRLLPLCTATRLWAEQQVGQVKEQTDEG